MTKTPSKHPITNADLPERESQRSSHRMGEPDLLCSSAMLGLTSKPCKAQIDAANALSNAGLDNPTTIAARQSCIAAFPARARLAWFAKVRTAILAKHGGKRRVPDPAAYHAEIEHLFETLKSLCSLNAQEAEFVEAAEIWIDQTRVGQFSDVNDKAGSVRALDRYLAA